MEGRGRVRVRVRERERERERDTGIESDGGKFITSKSYISGKNDKTDTFSFLIQLN